MAHTYTTAGDHVDAIQIIVKELAGLLSESQRSTVLEELSKEIIKAETDQRQDIMGKYKSMIESIGT